MNKNKMRKVRSIIFILVFYFIFILVKSLTFLFFIVQLKRWYPRNKGSVVFIESLPTENAGHQYRAKKWAEIFSQNNLSSKVITTIPEINKFNQLLKTNVFQYYLTSLIKRFFQTFSILTYETIIVRRELLQYNNYGNLFFEKLILSCHQHVILDFDDDINQHKTIKDEHSLFGKILSENKNKFYDTLRLYEKFTVGSEYLKQLVLRENKKIDPNSILVVPTCVDYNRYKAKDYSKIEDKIAFGWIGTPGNLIYLDLIVNSLNNINKETPISLIVISSKDYVHKDANFEIINLPWSLKDEIRQLYQIDIGLMPLIETPMEKGKSGFKLIQYMGLGIVSIASAITVNNDIVKDNDDGFLVYNNDDWERTIVKVIQRKSDFVAIGEKAKENNNLNYTFDANTNKYLSFLKKF
jgi:glycosyltransferase involved in cell wall biosynthesis